MEDKEIYNETWHNSFYVVKPQRGNIHGLIPQPPAKQIHYDEKDLHTQGYQHMISTLSYQLLVYPRA